MKVSVIIPVYNSENYLRKAVECLVHEECDDYEIMLIDDGSTDNSGKICDELAAEYPQIVVYHKKNGGMCSARNFALDKAKGEYVTFMDNDDICRKGFVADNYNIGIKYNADVVRFGREYYVIDNGKTVSSDIYAPEREIAFTGDEIFKNYREIRHSNGVWTGMYKKSFLDKHNIRFDETLRHGHEDTLFNLTTLRYANVIAMNPHSYYVWMRRFEHSSSAKINKNRIDGIYKAAKEERALMIERKVRDYDYKTYSTSVMNFVSETIIAGFAFGNTCPYNFFKEIATESRKYLVESKILKSSLDFKSKVVYDLLMLKAYHTLYILCKVVYR
jgi:glycosyltransferase involved in cell wall biosynthesis